MYRGRVALGQDCRDSGFTCARRPGEHNQPSVVDRNFRTHMRNMRFLFKGAPSTSDNSRVALMPIAGNAKLPLCLALALGFTVAILSACDSTPRPVGEDQRQVTVVGSGQVQG